MARFDIKNPNGSVVFVRGTRVKPYANFSASLDHATARELVKYGVSITEQKETPVDETASAPVAPVAQPVAEETPAEETPAEETPAEETPAEEPVAEEPVAEEPVAEETPAEEPVAEEPTRKRGRPRKS